MILNMRMLLLVIFGFVFVSQVWAIDHPALNGVNMVESIVIINAPLAKVWQVSSNNSLAKKWSVFFAKIVPCPVSSCPKNQSLKPGDVGYVRRPYRNENESGIYWDEETLALSKSQSKIVKTMRSFNFNGYIWFNKGEHLVENIYEAIEPNKTKVTFKTRLFDRNSLSANVSWLQYKYWSIVGYIVKAKVKDAFYKNLVNIKGLVENGERYKRVHPYE